MSEIHFSDQLKSMSGSIRYSLTNDAVFHIAMEDSPMVSLKGLLASLLQIPAEEITAVEILNPIDIETAMSKELVLDIKAELNHFTIVNIELQTYYDPYYRERALLYLCRSYALFGPGAGDPCEHHELLSVSRSQTFLFQIPPGRC
ncbi:MAG: PD-(D/E)XK nuclease family transposase [Lachnospiraceae bacterium]|nr:PD-(D/E)XK nuclease family transposase [Lachnospiraceae bacterium]